MAEREKPSAENILTGTVALTSAGVIAAEVFLGLPHNPNIELPLMIAIANVQGIPATPILTVIRQTCEAIYEGNI